MRSFSICVDANLVVRRLADPTNVVIQRLWERWESGHEALHAPTLLRYEVTNALYRLQRAGHLDPGAVQDALEVVYALPISLHDNADLHTAAIALAARVNLPAAYDAHYLALTEQLGGQFWTLDQRLANAVRHLLPWVHLLT